jgi:hypothetical protein
VDESSVTEKVVPEGVVNQDSSAFVQGFLHDRSIQLHQLRLPIEKVKHILPKKRGIVRESHMNGPNEFQILRSIDGPPMSAVVGIASH